jgi:hypothetical protein
MSPGARTDHRFGERLLLPRPGRKDRRKPSAAHGTSGPAGATGHRAPLEQAAKQLFPIGARSRETRLWLPD